MKIGFSVTEECDAAIMLAIAATYANTTNKRVTMMQTAYKGGIIQDALIGGFNSGEGYFNDSGMDALLRVIKSSTAGESAVIDNSISFLNNRLNFITSTRKVERDLYYGDLYQYGSMVIELLNQHNHMVFVDVGRGYKKVQKKIIDDLDLVLVCVKQYRYYMDDVMQMDFTDRSRCIYLVVDYDENCNFNLTNMCKQYKLKRDMVCGVCHDPGYMNAVNTRKALPYLVNLGKTKKKDPAYPFMKSLIYTVSLLDKKVRERR